MKPTDLHACTVIDIHNHVWAKDGELDRDRAMSLLKAADCLGIDTVCVSLPLMTESPTPEEFRQANDMVFEALEMSDTFRGFCFVNPGYAEESVAELERCIVRHRMVGVKLYHQYRICDPALRPVMDYAAELGVPVLMHAAKLRDSANVARQPRVSHAEHFLKAAHMFPNTTLIQAHIGGGGDWEWNLRVLEAMPASAKYFIDISGSVVDAGIIRKTVATLGADRVLFATDGIMEEGIGKLLEAGLSEEQLQHILSRNAERILF
ncbi:MAG: amidohydrolase family protein [Candidatus Pacebacteria bacterium]|nr:amidohydrolase family protein [Candidatus Paceibacterota bacterium]